MDMLPLLRYDIYVNYIIYIVLPSIFSLQHCHDFVNISMSIQMDCIPIYVEGYSITIPGKA